MSNSNSRDCLRDELLQKYKDAQFQVLMHDYSMLEADECLQELETHGETPDGQRYDDFIRVFNHARRRVRVSTIAHRLPKMMNRAAVFLLFCFIILSVSVITVQAVRVDVLNFLIQMQDEYTSLRFDSKNNPLIGDSIIVPWKNTYAPTYFPEGYRIVRLQHYEAMKTIDLVNEADDYIHYFDYASINAANIDTEEADEVREIFVNGNPGLLIRKDGRTTFAWVMDNRMFVIYAQLHDSEIMRIAESIKLID